jgi:hypothetical protein
MRSGAGTALVLMATLVAVPVWSEGTPERVVKYDKDALTVRLTRVSLTEVLDEIGRQTGAEIRGQVREPREVSADFDQVALPEAMHRLLGSQNFALVYSDSGQLKAVKLLGGPQEGGAPQGASVVSVSTTTQPQVSPAALISYMDRPAPVAVTPRLGQVLGTQTPTLRQLMEVGLHNEDPTMRSEAVRVGLQAVEAEPELRAAVLAAVGGMEDSTLVAILRGSAGERAEEVATNVATQTRVGELRVKASSVLQALRNGS